MKERPYQHLPPLEHRPDSFPYRMTPAQRKRANSLIRREHDLHSPAGESYQLHPAPQFPL